MVPTTLLDLLQALERDKFYSNYYGMLRSTAKHISEFLNLPLEKIDIEMLLDLRQQPAFKRNLIERRYKFNSRRSYLNFVGILIAGAKQLGWTSAKTALSAAWKEILDAVPRGDCRQVIHYAIRRGKLPAELAESDLDAYSKELLDAGKSYRHAMTVKRSFVRALARNGLAKIVPGIACPLEKKDYGIPLSLMPEPLRREIEDLLEWKQAKYAPGRGKRLRPVTAQNLKCIICQLYGFVRDVQGRKDVDSLEKLATEESILAFNAWSINERGLQGYTLASRLRLLHAALRCYPATKQQDFKWLPAAIADLPRAIQSEIRERKMEKYVDYEILRKIPDLMRAERKVAAKQGSLALAWLVHDELLTSWLLRLVWRQLNVRCCQIGGSAPHLFKAPIPPLTNMSIPPWVQEKRRSDPETKFWQFRFREAETKTGCERRGVVPHALVALLEEYLEHYRPLLLRGADPGTVFVNRDGGQLTTGQIINLVKDITWKYAQRPVNPHLFRDSFAFWWLERHPEDYLTLSKMLWHSNIQTTINIYGGKFDESAALCRVEQWLDQVGGDSGNHLTGAVKIPDSATAVAVPKLPSGQKPENGTGTKAA